MASLTSGSASKPVLGGNSSLALSRDSNTNADSGKSVRHGNMYTFVDRKVKVVRARRNNVGKTSDGLVMALFATSEHRKKTKGRFKGAYLKVDTRALKEECKEELRDYFGNSNSTVHNQDRVKLVKVFSGAEDTFDRRAFTQSMRANGVVPKNEASSVWQDDTCSNLDPSRVRDVMTRALHGDLRGTVTSADGTREAYRYARENVLREGALQPHGKSWRRQSFDSVLLENGSFYEDLTPLSAAMQEGIARDLVPVLLKHVFNSGSRGSDRDIAVGDGDDDHISVEGNEVVAINLKNYGLGDDRSACLLAALAVCPSVRRLDVSGNRMTDVGMRGLLLCVKQHLQCDTLRIGNNVVGASAAEVLANSLRDDECALKELSLTKCRISDAVCATLAAGLAVNASVRLLDLSDNKLGGEDRGDGEGSGAAALALCLRQNRSLEELDLSWNNIRRGAARVLCESLCESYRLVSVQLAHNNLGDGAATLLARRLRDHGGSLQRLDLAHNGLTYRSALVVACMLESNSTITEVRVDGNNIGSLGGQLLLRSMYVAAQRPRPLRVLLSECGLRGAAFGEPVLEESSGQQLLNLDDPYDHALASTFLRLANTRAAATLKDLKIRPDNTRSAAFEASPLSRKPLQDRWSEHLAAISTLLDSSAAAKSNKKLAPDPSRLHEQLLQLGARMGLSFTDVFARKLASTLRKVGAGGMNRPFKFLRLVFKTAFILVDSDRAGALDVNQLAACLSLLGYKGAALGAEGCLRYAVDIMRCVSANGASERIEQSAFVRMMMWQCCCFGPAAPTPLLDLSGARWDVPSTGTLKFEFIIEKSLPSVIKMSSDSAFERFCDAAAGALRCDQDRSNIMHLCCSSGDFTLSSAQAEVLLRNFRDTSEPLFDSVERLLPLLASPAEACVFLAKALSFKELLMLRQRTGSYFRVVSGVGCSGHYSLDLSRKRDRLTYERLLLVNDSERRRVSAEPRNTSQKGDFDNFRNECVGGRYVKLGRPPAGKALPVSKMEFDYVSTSRPLQGMPPLAEEAFVALVEQVLGSGGSRPQRDTAIPSPSPRGGGRR